MNGRLYAASTVAAAGGAYGTWRQMAPEWVQHQIDVIHMVTAAVCIGLAAGTAAFHVFGRWCR